MERPLADDPHAQLALLRAGIPLSFCPRCDELSSLSRCPLCRGEVWPVSPEELVLDIEADARTVAL